MTTNGHSTERTPLLDPRPSQGSYTFERPEVFDSVITSVAPTDPAGFDGCISSPYLIPQGISNDDVDGYLEEDHSSQRKPTNCNDRNEAFKNMQKNAKVQPKYLGGVTVKQFWVIFAGLMVANFICAFDSTIMASTHTSVTSTFNASNSASWLSTSFLLTSTSFQALYGRVSDIYGRRIPFLVGLFLFSGGTLWCALAQSIGSFIAARALCGIGCGGVWTMGAIVLSDLIPIEVRGTYQSYNNLVYGSGCMLGAGLGGWMADTLGWRWAFGIQVPPLFVTIIVIAMIIPDTMGKTGCKAKPASPFGSLSPQLPQRPKFDALGSVLLPTSMGLLIFALSTGGNTLPWDSPLVYGSFLLSLVLAYYFIRAEASASAPIIPLKLITSPPRSSLIFSNFLQGISVNGIIFNLPLYFQAVRLESATMAGGRLLIPSMASTFSSVSTGFIITRTGRLRPTIWLGSTMLVVGSVLLALMTYTRDLPDLGYMALLVPCNMGLGFAFPSTIMSVLATSRQSDQAVATSTLMLWRSLGSVVGVASSSLVLQNVLIQALMRNVRGPGGVFGETEMEVVEKVRRSVVAVGELGKDGLWEGYQPQVVESYEIAVRWVFFWALAMAVWAVWLVVGLKLPRLSKTALGEFRKSQGEEDDDEDDDDDGDKDEDVIARRC